jgi:hypothetical protein
MVCCKCAPLFQSLQSVSLLLMNLTVIVMSDPKQGEEALGRLFNALALTAQAHAHGDDVQLVFQGAGTRWPAELSKLGHPAQPLYDSVRPCVAGASKACAAVFGAPDGGVNMLDDLALPTGEKLHDIRKHLAAGRQTLIF